MDLKETDIGQHLSGQNHSEYKFSDFLSSAHFYIHIEPRRTKKEKVD